MPSTSDRPWVANGDDSEDWERAQVPIQVPAADFLGTVTVNYISLEEDYWTAVWELGVDHRDLSGPRSDVIRWARSQTASHYLIFDPEIGDLVSRTADEVR